MTYQIQPDTRRHKVSEELLSLSEAATRLGISQEALRKRVERRKVPARKVGGHWRVVFAEPSKEPKKQSEPDIRLDA